MNVPSLPLVGNALVLPAVGDFIASFRDGERYLLHVDSRFTWPTWRGPVWFLPEARAMPFATECVQRMPGFIRLEPVLAQ